MIPTWGAAFGANAIFNSAEFRADLTHSAVPDKAAPGTTGTFTRATTSTWQNNDGYLVTGVAGEIGFVGARRVRNQFTFTQAFDNAAWAKFRSSISADATTAPDGTLTADKLVEDGTAGATHFMQYNTVGTVGSAEVLSISAKPAGRDWLYLQLGNSHFAYFNVSTGTVGTVQGSGTVTAITLDAEGFYRCSLKAVRAGSQINYVVPASADNTVSYNGDGVSGLYIWGAQLEDVTAQTTQTAGEYVSVGALDYRSTQNPLYYSTPGTAGHYASTPNAPAHSITGDIDIDFDASSVDWASGANDQIIGNYDTAVGLSGWRVLKVAANTLRFDFRNATTGSTTTLAGPSTAANIVGNRYRYRFKRVGATYTWYQSTDNGSTWTVVVGPTVGTAGAIVASIYPLILANDNLGISFMMALSLYSARVYSGDRDAGGVLKVDFNPHRDATTPTGTITSSTTGEVWTLNGASSVIRSAAYHGSMVDGVKCFPTDLSGNPIPSTTMLGYVAEGARTNLCLQSQDFATTWTVTDATISVNTKVAADGTTTADSLVENAAAATAHVVTQAITKAASSAAYTLSVYVEKGGRDWVALTLYDNTALGARAWFNVNTGVVGSTANIGAGMGTITANIESVGGGIYRCKMSVSASGTATRIDPYIYSTNADAVLSVNGINAVGLYLWGAQLELGSFASSYIATTTVAVTRNADSLTYSGGDIPNLKTLCATFKRESGVSSNGWILGLSDGTTSNISGARTTDATDLNFTGNAGGVAQWNTSTTPVYTPATSVKVAASTATNDIKMAFKGIAQTPDTTATVPTVTQLNVGHIAGILQLSGNVGGIYGWTRNLSQSELNAVTS